MNVTLALFTIDKLEIIQMFNRILMDKLCYIHLYNGVLLSNKKLLKRATAWMNFENIMTE